MPRRILTLTAPAFGATLMACSVQAPDACLASPPDPKSDALVDAADEGDLDAVRRALAAGANPRYVDGRKNEVLGIVTCSTAVSEAAAGGHTVVLREVLAAGGDASHRESAQWTPLHYAAQGGHRACVEVLLDAKADVNAKTSLGYTALSEAVSVGSTDIVELLLAAGADPDLPDDKGVTPREIAQRRGSDMKALLPAAR